MSSISRLIAKLARLAEFALFYLKEVLVSNLRVARDVLTPAHSMRPALLSLDIAGLSDRQLLVATNLITMTPGTLSVDVSADRRRLQVHAMYVDDPVAAVRELETNYIRRVQDVF